MVPGLPDPHLAGEVLSVFGLYILGAVLWPRVLHPLNGNLMKKTKAQNS